MPAFNLLEIIIVLALSCIVAATGGRSWGNIRRTWTIEEAVGVVRLTLLAVQQITSTRGRPAEFRIDSDSASLSVLIDDQIAYRAELPLGTGFGFVTPAVSTGGIPVSSADDGIHLDGQANSRRFLADGLPEGGRSIGLYLICESSGKNGLPPARAVTMSAVTGKIKVWKPAGTEDWKTYG